MENGYDIAMLKLKTEVPWKLPELAYTPDSVKYGTNVFVLGWGEDEEGQIETYLQVGMTLFVPRETCNETPLWDGLVKEHQICAGLLSSDTCRGAFPTKERKTFFQETRVVLCFWLMSRRTFPKDLLQMISSSGSRLMDGKNAIVLSQAFLQILDTLMLGFRKSSRAIAHRLCQNNLHYLNIIVTSFLFLCQGPH